MNKNAKKWVKALRSGKYSQGRRWLLKDGRYCCLGVACQLAIESGVDVSVKKHPLCDGVTVFDKNDGFLPEQVSKWLGLLSFDGRFKRIESLTSRNDKGATFSEIADLIESEPKGLFRTKVI